MPTKSEVTAAIMAQAFGDSGDVLDELQAEALAAALMELHRFVGKSGADMDTLITDSAGIMAGTQRAFKYGKEVNAIAKQYSEMVVNINETFENVRTLKPSEKVTTHTVEIVGAGPRRKLGVVKGGRSG